MTSTADFYRRVARGARLGTPEEAAAVTRDVLRSIAQVADRRTLDALRAQLPPEISADLDGVPAGDDPLIDREIFVGRMVNRLDTMHLYDETLGGLDLVSVYADDDAARQARAVFAAVRSVVDAPTTAALESSLPQEIGEW